MEPESGKECERRISWNRKPQQKFFVIVLHFSAGTKFFTLSTFPRPRIKLFLRLHAMLFAPIFAVSSSWLAFACTNLVDGGVMQNHKNQSETSFFSYFRANRSRWWIIYRKNSMDQKVSARTHVNLNVSLRWWGFVPFNPPHHWWKILLLRLLDPSCGFFFSSRCSPSLNGHHFSIEILWLCIQSAQCCIHSQNQQSINNNV